MAYEADARHGVSGAPLPRELFEVTAQYAYLNHAAVGVLPATSRNALNAFTNAHARGGVMGTWPIEARMPEFRARIARFIGARSDEIAILRNTAEGANAIAAGFDWRGAGCSRRWALARWPGATTR